MVREPWTRPLSQDCVDFFHCHLAGTALRSCGIYMEFEFFASSTWSTYQNAVEIPFPPTFWLSESQGRCMHIHHSRAQCVKRASWICILRETNRVCGTLFTHTLYIQPVLYMYACSSGAFDQCMLAPDWLAKSQSWYVTQPSLAPCSEYMHTYCVYTICVLTDIQMVYTIIRMHVTARSQDWLCMHTCTIRAVYNVRVNKFAMDCVKSRVNAMRCMHSCVQRRHNETAIGRAR